MAGIGVHFSQWVGMNGKVSLIVRSHENQAGNVAFVRRENC